MQDTLLKLVSPLGLVSIASPILLMLVAPLFVGVISKLRARIEARQGASVLQPYYDLQKLLVKETILPEASSWIFRLFPYLSLVITICVAILTPVLCSRSLFAPYADLIFIFGLFLILAFFLVLSSFEAGTSFVGMGSSREAFLVSILEPVILLVILALSMEFNTTNLFTLVKDNAHNFELISHPSSFFTAIAFLVIILTESKRFPVDNPNTHLELTMVHEALLLEYSGKYLAMLEYASMLKTTIFASIFYSLFFSYGIAEDLTLHSLLSSLFNWLLKLFVFALMLAVYEKSTAKLRLFKVPELLSFAIVLSLIAVFAHYYVQLW